MESGSILANVSLYDDDQNDLMMVVMLTIMTTGGKWLNPGQCVISETSLHDHWSQPWGGTQAADKVVVVDVLDNGALDDEDEY